MKILIDINHPSHVHYFKNLIWKMQKNGHVFLIVSRDKDISFKLLNAYGFKYYSRGKGGEGIIGKLLYLFKGDFALLRIARKFKPDLFLSFGSPYAAQVSSIMGKPHIAIDDTDIAKYMQMMYVPFTDVIITPIGYNKNHGKKQIFLNTTFDLAYLLPKYYKPKINVFEALGIKEGTKYVFIRFTIMKASHDFGYKVLTDSDKINIVNELSKKHHVFISSEGKLPKELEKFKINIAPDKIHDVLYYADLFLGESGSMSTESITLGTPAINMAPNALEVGVFDIFIKHKLLYILPDFKEAVMKAKEILKQDKVIFNENRISFLRGKIDITEFLVWFIENYPKSKSILSNSDDFVIKFKIDEIN